MNFHFHKLKGSTTDICCDVLQPREYSCISDYLEDSARHIDDCERELERLENAKAGKFVGYGCSSNAVYSEYDKDGLYIQHDWIETAPDNFLTLENAEFLLNEWKTYLEDQKERSFELDVQIVEEKNKRDTRPLQNRNIC
ncbi:hypothetical protein KJ652_03420 [Patescibacteria group bacterium]|nr:hypothetical protein [Patescibacteria group bacterium]MBU1123615.1 hypothetical protein [Patescibacteria group bacterium]MBU1911336.1 hypothetical protein [Patescibacteria group bacterium]